MRRERCETFVLQAMPSAESKSSYAGVVQNQNRAPITSEGGGVRPSHVTGEQGPLGTAESKDRAYTPTSLSLPSLISSLTRDPRDREGERPNCGQSPLQAGDRLTAEIWGEKHILVQ